MRKIKYLIPALVWLVLLTGCEIATITQNPFVFWGGVAFFVWLAFKMNEK